MIKLLSKIGITLALSSTITTTALACTDFRLTAQDGTLMIARSMEFSTDLKSNLMTSPRGKAFTTTAPDGKPGIAWKAKYGYVFLDGMNTGMALDGLNEQGLAMEALYLPTETEYQTVPAGQDAHALFYLSFGDWILGNFKTIDEVKQALAQVYVFAQPLPQVSNMIFPLHFAITDNTGKGIVVEFLGGNIKTYDNTLGVMTNAPTYDWQVTNLRNYLNLTPTTPQPVIDTGMTFVATGQGSGMHGLPGDISPPSRFVKIAIMLKSILQPANANDLLNVSQHVINNVDIPSGFVREAQDNNRATNEYTQWVVFKDLTNKIFYYRTYNDLTVRGVDMKKVNFAENAPQLKMPITSQQYVIDMTGKFTGKK